MEEYNIILFKNKYKYKIFKSYKSYKKAESLYESLKSNNDVRYNIQNENGVPVKYEIALVQKRMQDDLGLFVSDELGRNVKVETTNKNYTILSISEFKLPEKIYHFKSKTRITFQEFISKFLLKEKHYLISGLNNKFIVQEDENIELFILKNTEDVSRFFESLFEYMSDNKNLNAIIVKDISTLQRKFLYDLLVKKGFDKKMLYSKFTTSPPRS